MEPLRDSAIMDNLTRQKSPPLGLSPRCLTLEIIILRSITAVNRAPSTVAAPPTRDRPTRPPQCVAWRAWRLTLIVSSGLTASSAWAGGSPPPEPSTTAGWWRWEASGISRPANSIAAFGGFGTDKHFSGIATRPWNAPDSGDRLVGLALARELGRVGHGALGFELEGSYGYHFERQRYHEFAVALIGRWHDFPWNEWLVTSFGLGIGPSFTTRVPRLEADHGGDTNVLNQANLEITFALPNRPERELFLRLEHRSGILGLLGPAGAESNFAVVGYRYRF